MYWIGKGVLSHDKKDYGFGDELPVGISEKTLKSLKSKGKISEKKPPGAIKVPTATEKKLKSVSAELSRAQGTITELTAELSLAQGTITELTTPTKKGGKK